MALPSRNLFAAAAHNPRVARRAGLTTAQARQYIGDYTTAGVADKMPVRPIRYAYNAVPNYAAIPAPGETPEPETP